VLGSGYLQRYLAVANEIKLVGLLPLTEDELARVESYVGGASDKQVEVAILQAT
jgi:hypothetical protein